VVVGRQRIRNLVLLLLDIDAMTNFPIVSDEHEAASAKLRLLIG
jgi:hypothetical protein